MTLIPQGFTVPVRVGRSQYTKVVRAGLTLFYKKDLETNAGWYEVTQEDYEAGK